MLKLKSHKRRNFFKINFFDLLCQITILNIIFKKNHINSPLQLVITDKNDFKSKVNIIIMTPTLIFILKNIKLPKFVTLKI